MSNSHKSRILPLMIGPIPIRELLPIALIGGLLLALAFGLLHLSTACKRDQVDATVQQGSGTVTDLIFAFTKDGSRPVFVELEGRQVNLDLWNAGPILRLKVGQKVQYRYSVGRRGTWYLKQIEATPTGSTGAPVPQ